MKFKVHVFAVVRVPIEIDADSQEDALNKADEVDLETVTELRGCEHADEIVGYLVDEVGDEEYEKSRRYESDHSPIKYG